MVRMIQHLVPNMKEQGWGRIIAISSLVSAMPLAEQASYSTFDNFEAITGRKPNTWRNFAISYREQLAYRSDR